MAGSAALRLAGFRGRARRNPPRRLSGIGRAHNIAMSTLEGFTLPGDVSASRRYWREDIIEPEVTITERGTIIAPDAPGIGFAVERDRIDQLAVKRETLRAAI